MSKRKLLILLIFLICISFCLPSMIAANNQSEINVNNSNAVMDFPLLLNFSADIESEFPLSDLRLKYKVDRITFADVTSEIVVDFVSSDLIKARYSLDMRRIGGLPPGTIINYWWKVTDTAGYQYQSDPLEYEVADERFDWNSLSQGKINIYWYEWNQSFAESLMESAHQALDYLKETTGAVPESAIDIYIYNGSEDLQSSMIYPQEWTGGVAYTSLNIIAIGITPDALSWGQGAMKHELTHTVIHQVINNPYSGIPVWLDEGLAMYSEGLLSPQFTQYLIKAVEDGNLLTVRSLSSPFSALTDKASLSYAQSYSLVEYLIQKYGSDKMLELLNTFALGCEYDRALLDVYGFDMDGLNAEWLEWIKEYFKP
jgi:hypothetical protein